MCASLFPHPLFYWYVVGMSCMALWWAWLCSIQYDASITADRFWRRTGCRSSKKWAPAAALPQRYYLHTTIVVIVARFFLSLPKGWNGAKCKSGSRFSPGTHGRFGRGGRGETVALPLSSSSQLFFLLVTNFFGMQPFLSLMPAPRDCETSPLHFPLPWWHQFKSTNHF